MTRWWRAHASALDDPKVQRLPGDMFKSWFNLLCVACMRDGKLPPISDVAFALRKTERETKKLLDAFVEAELVDVTEDGWMPHNWNGRQYKSDVSNERVKRHRERKCNVTSTVTETPSESEAETDTDVTSNLQVEREGARAPRTPKPEKTDGKFKLPADWRPDAEERGFAADLGLDPDAAADVYVDHFTNRKGKSERRDAAGWRKRWGIWCRADAERSRPLGKGPSRAVQPPRGNEAFYDQLAVLSDRSRAERDTVGGRRPDAADQAALPDEAWHAPR